MDPDRYPGLKSGELPFVVTAAPPVRSGKTSVLKACTYMITALGLAWMINVLTHAPLPRRADLSDDTLGLTKSERLFLSTPDAKSARAASATYSNHPHLAGSSEDFSDAKAILKFFQKELNIDPPPDAYVPIFPAGSPESRNATLKLTSRDVKEPSAWIDTYYPVLNTPLDRSVEILDDNGQVIWTADLVEDGDSRDEDAHKYKNSVPTWHGLSKDGEAEGGLVYANYGTKEDYDDLISVGANLTGKIVITRYGALFRGLKIKRAQELGAAGVLIYSDPRDDGYVTVENGFTPYPAGPARNPTSVQRGSVQFLSSYPGDPTTPGYPSYRDAQRQEGTNIPNIPSLPISWRNAQRLLEEIGNSYITSKDGRKILSGKSSQSRIRLVNHVDTKVTPIWNAMASIPGHIRDEVVIIGCHRDAWVLGAADPISGTASLHEIVRGFGRLLKSGWRPLRTVVIASWDAEEYGLVGSTEWGEDFASWISQHAVAYLNVDVSVSGSRWHVGGSPSLAHLIKRTALDVPHPTKLGKTLWDAKDDLGPFTTNTTDYLIDSEFLNTYAAELKSQASATGVSPLGSGSDFTVFLQRLGVASTDQGFGSTPNDAAYHYHSIYDSQRFQDIYADPDFARHVAVAKHLGLMALRIIDSIIVPLNTTQYALELSDYLDKVEELVPGLPQSSTPPDFSELRKAIERLQHASLRLDHEKVKAERKFKKLLRGLPSHGKCHRKSQLVRRIEGWVKGVFGVSDNHAMRPFDDDVVKLYLGIQDSYPHSHHLRGSPIKKFIKAAKRVSKANNKIIAFERGFISEGGIKDRTWYKHLVVAPGKWLGYGATTFPALTEALADDHNSTLAQHEADRLVILLNRLTRQIAH